MTFFAGVVVVLSPSFLPLGVGIVFFIVPKSSVR
jgi:hypothetical protein